MGSEGSGGCFQQRASLHSFAVHQFTGRSLKDQALKFIDWLGSAEVQGEWAQQFSSMPVNKAAAEKAKPEVVEFVKALKQQDIDWNFVQENIGAWVEKIELEYMT